MQVATQDAPVNGPERHTDWNAVNWRQAERRVRNLRQRIFAAAKQGDHKRVASLQKLMVRSYANTLVSVRRVTQVNQGKHTPGVDKVVVKTPEGRGRLVDALMTFQPWRAKPARRVYIPKANGKLRPLGIPTVSDRVMQARVKNALEPAWEARFEGTSYGFRPGRGCHDAIGRIYTLATPNKRRQWIVDADIQGAFDHISHDHLLRAIGPVPGRELICQWLKAGYVELGAYHDTEEGTPQGGVISPLLANIALHGMEQALGVQYDRRGYASAGCKRMVVRYADDFVVFCESREDAEAVLDILKDWLAARGLSLSEDKTRIVHLTQGFDFLGFNVRHYADRRAKTGYRLLITPSRESVAKLRKRLKAEWRFLEGHNVQAVLKRLNPIIRGGANYFRIGVASRTFKLLDHWMFRRMLQWLRHSHRCKSREWLNRRYLGKLHPQREDHFVFGDKAQGGYLLKFAWFKIERHVIVRGVASPDDSTLRAYWAGRNKAKAKDHAPRWQDVAARQNETCPVCGQPLFNGEELHLHHIVPRTLGGDDRLTNLILFHLFCHQQVHGGKAPSSTVRGLLRTHDAVQPA